MQSAARIQAFLDTLADSARPNLDGNDVAVVAAHPDDETIGCGALLDRLAGVRVIVITDGAPRDLADAHAHGFESPGAYASARAIELRAAMDVAGIGSERVTQLGIPDQQSARKLGWIADELFRLFERHQIGLVLTHAYEGGHPDHDAAAFCVCQAANRSPNAIGILEMPFYRADNTGAVQQSFAAASAVPIAVALTEKERRLKRQMIAAYRTQAGVLAGFSLEMEQFRVAPDYDFHRLPNGGRVLYDRENWGLTGQDWLRLVNGYFAAEQLCA